MYTEEFNLTPEEIETAGKIAKSLSKNAVGKSNAIHRDTLIEKLLQAKKPHVTNKWRLAEMIQYIRVNNLCPPIIFSGQSYYVSNDTKEHEDYLIALEEHINEIRRIQAAFQQQMDSVQVAQK